MNIFSWSRISYGGVIVVLLAFLYVYYITSTVPSSFPVGKSFTINENESLRSISSRLEEEKYIHSALWFRVWISTLGKDRFIQLGNYHFDTPHSLGGVVKKLVTENPDKPLIQVTVPEGSTVDEVAVLFKQALPSFSKEIFEQKVIENKAEGKLFPSTYFLLPSYTEEDIVKLMTDTFEKKYFSTFTWTIIPEPLTKREEVISLAAIIEGEAKKEEDMRIIAGILLSRLKLKMPLQVDVAKITYTTRELPAIPINNPGLVSLAAVLNPIETEYLYYITGNEGQMYYAKTFNEHKINIKKYLK